MKLFLLLLLSIFCAKPPVPSQIDKAEARKAFTLLNNIRANPAAFAAEMPFLTEIGPRPLLRWNDTLAAVAEAKALDMATHLYIEHVDSKGYGMNHSINKAGYKLNDKWLAHKGMNNFESLCAGAKDDERAIRLLITDQNVPSLGHRKHLLGLDQWNASLYDIGIGYARPVESSPYMSYVCVLIAKHDW